MRLQISLIAVLALSACAPEVPDSRQGVGFKTYDEYLREQAERETQLRRPAQTVLPPERQAATEPTEIVTIASASIDAAPETAPETTATEVAAVDQQARSGISDEQDFEAVSGRESIESDAERIARNRQQYVVIQPTDLPSRPGNLGPSIVDFALATNNPVGQPLYSRLSIGAQSRFNRNCAKYSSSDQAQQDFLARGGPEKDRMGLDPDGDGFACYWDPTPFRAARRAVSGN